MSTLSKFFGLALFTGLSFASINALGMPSTSSDALYSESIAFQRSAAEIPSSLDAEEENESFNTEKNPAKTGNANKNSANLKLDSYSEE